MLAQVLRVLPFLLLPLAAQAESDHLAYVTFPVPGPHGLRVVERTAADMRSVFQVYQPGIDAQTRIVKPLTLTGTAAEPEVTVSMEKCVGILCRTVDIDGLVSMREVTGPCEANFDFEIDLGRSSATLSSVYDQLSAVGCYKSQARDGAGTLELDVSVRRAPSYTPGGMQPRILNVMLQQVQPISQAFAIVFNRAR